jgi:hypothetical protein
MQRILWALLLVLLLPVLVSAQTSERPKGQAYVYFAPGVESPRGGLSGSTEIGTAQIGGGGEFLIVKGLGLGLDLGYLAAWEHFAEGVAVISPDVSYHFFPREGKGKVVPFVTAGYTNFFQLGGQSGANVGAGMHYWIKDHVGLRFEVRDSIVMTAEKVHEVGFRIGLALR